jgi:hypothetical protein
MYPLDIPFNSNLYILFHVHKSVSYPIYIHFGLAQDFSISIYNVFVRVIF